MSDALYERFDSGEAFQQAVDRLLAASGRELRIFDSDAAALRLNDAARVDALERFLRASRTRRLFMVLHDPEPLARHCARMMSLISRYSHVIQVNRTQESIRELQDAFLLIDSLHYVRRPVAASFRGALGLNDETEALALRGRFDEIWAASDPAVWGSTTGL
jgi:AcrR family transcriptional regulator